MISKILTAIIMCFTILIPGAKNELSNEITSETTNQITYKIVPATEQEIEEIGYRLLPILGMYQKDYNCYYDSIYDDMFSYNILEYIYPDYDEEVEKYIAEPLYKSERGIVRWSKLIYENDPLGKFPPIPKELYNEDGEVDEKLAYSLPDNFKWTDMVLGYNKYSGEYIDWLVEGVWNGKADHNTFFKFEDGTLCYYCDGHYYTPELAGDRGGGIFFGPVVQYVNPIEDNKYSVGYLIVDAVGEPVGSGTAVLAMKETKNSFRFWSIFSIDYDTEIPNG